MSHWPARAPHSLEERAKDAGIAIFRKHWLGKSEPARTDSICGAKCGFVPRLCATSSRVKGCGAARLRAHCQRLFNYQWSYTAATLSHNPSGAPKTRDYLAVRRFVGRSPAASVAEREAPEKLAVGRVPFLCQLLESRTCQDQTERPMREGNR